MGRTKLAVRQTGRKVTVFLTAAGSVEAGKRLAQHPVARQAQACIKNNAGNRTATSLCMQKLKK